ncbi:hypothetical protein OIU77_007260 [Salix suchowensis]|uniref:non-specific serine/threonine protein kinase n=1 Tax=Salix suchowensis TaxID=1278906 RepID=A0ABQ9AFI2_9ROSI|nr:hypothetical protein OIU77_007260 [Salix suchowensis]
MSAKAEMEFAVEVEILGRVRHKNLLSLRGFYAGGDERLIVYDYMPNHSLIAHLHGQLADDCLLDWHRRMNIVIGSAEGLAYLHHEANPHIIHRDIKASNVLLDTEFQAKVADFGFAKLIPEGVTHLTTRLPGGVRVDIVKWVNPFVEKGAFDHVADPRLKGRYDRAQLEKAIMVAMRCTDRNPEKRPTMMKVVEWLSGGLGRTEEVEDEVEEHAEIDYNEMEYDDGTDYDGYYGKIQRERHHRK